MVSALVCLTSADALRAQSTNIGQQVFQSEFEYVTNSAPIAANVPARAGKPKVDPFSDPLIKSVQARHDKAVAGDKKETQALTTDLEKWTKEQPNNHLLQAYLGSVYTLDCRDAWPGPGKITYLQNGGKELDAAVLAAPNNPAVRFIRAIDYFELPRFSANGRPRATTLSRCSRRSTARSRRPTSSASRHSRRSITMPA